MGFDINKQIKTILDYKEIALIAVAFGTYLDTVPVDDELRRECNRIVDRLGNELYDYPNEDHTKK